MGELGLSMLCGVLAFVFEKLNMIRLSTLLWLLMFWRGSTIMILLQCEDLLVLGYPKKKCKLVQKNEILLGWKSKKNVNVPVEMFNMAFLGCIEFICFSIACLVIKETHFNLLECLPLFYCFIMMITDIIFSEKAEIIAFHNTFKRMTFRNFKYKVLCSRFKAPPSNAKLGKCVIIGIQKRWRRQYYIVKVKKSSNIYEKVMYCGGEKLDKEKEYVLYEICNVKYIV